MYAGCGNFSLIKETNVVEPNIWMQLWTSWTVTLKQSDQSPQGNYCFYAMYQKLHRPRRSRRQMRVLRRLRTRFCKQEWTVLTSSFSAGTTRRGFISVTANKAGKYQRSRERESRAEKQHARPATRPSVERLRSTRIEGYECVLS